MVYNVRTSHQSIYCIKKPTVRTNARIMEDVQLMIGAHVTMDGLDQDVINQYANYLVCMEATV